MQWRKRLDLSVTNKQLLVTVTLAGLSRRCHTVFKRVGSVKGNLAGVFLMHIHRRWRLGLQLQRWRSVPPNHAIDIRALIRTHWRWTRDA